MEALAQEYGFGCTDYSVQWNEAGDWPEQITMWLVRQEEASSAAGSGSKQDRGIFWPEEDGAGGSIADISSVEQIQVDQETMAEFKSNVEEEVTYYEPSELRQLHQALQTVWQLEEEQILLYWER